MLLAALAAGCDDSGATADDAELDARIADASAADMRPARDARVLPDFAPLVVHDAGADAAPPPPPDGGLPSQAEPIGDPGPWGPTTRVNALEIPEDAATARAAGCLVEGASAGSAVRNLIALAGGGLEQIVEPDADGRIATVLLFRAAGWPTDSSALDVQSIDFEFYEGTQDADLAFLAKREAFVDDEPDNGPRISFPGTPIEAGWFETAPGAFRLPVSLALAPGLALPLSGARLSGRLAADDPGFRIDRGILTGYLTDDDAAQLVNDIKASCEVEEPPGVCALLGGQLERPVEEIVGIVVGILGGFEVRFEAGVAAACDPNEEAGCNAVALCVQLTARGVELLGVEP